MTQRTLEMSSAESLAKRFKARLAIALSLARAYRFVAELEPWPGEEPEPFVVLASSLKSWRQALRDEDAEAGLDAVERTWALLETCRQRVIFRDATIEAYRVRWACEKAPLRRQTIDSLARFYRLLPFSTSSQSKYEYVLTRLLAGPIGPERKVARTEQLIDTVVAREASWGAPSVVEDENEVATIILALKSFADEATRHADAATFTSSALLRRFGSFKASIGDKLFDPRLGVAVVETNVAVLNVLNQLLADAGGQPMRWNVAVKRKSALISLPPTVVEVLGVEAGVSIEGTKADGDPSAEGTGDSSTGPPPQTRPDLRTGEVDLSGLEFVLRRRRPRSDDADLVDAGSRDDESSVDDSEPDESGHGEDRDQSGAEAPLDAASVHSPPTPPPLLSESQSGPEPVRAADAEQQPSVRAFELGKLEENKAIIDRYLAWPRSPEVWRLDLDVFLGPSTGGILNSESHAAERRQALELIMASDDLICIRATKDEAPSAEHRGEVKSVANGMLLLRTSLLRSADLAEGDPRDLEALLYVADHLLWERLRLEASLKRNPRRERPAFLPRTNQAEEAVVLRTRSRGRQRTILLRLVGVAAALTTIVGILGFSLPRAPVDPEVNLVQLGGLPGAELFDDARSFRTTLFMSAGRTWALLAREERRSIVRGLGAFATERGLDTVSVVGPGGEPLASFKDDEVMLDGELNRADLARR